MPGSSIYDSLAELSKAVFIPPPEPWSARKSEIYPKFDYFATMVARYVADPQVAAELAAIRRKLVSNTE